MAGAVTGNAHWREASVVAAPVALIKDNAPLRSGDAWSSGVVPLEAIDVHDERVINGGSLQMKLAKDLPLVQGDRVRTATSFGHFAHNAIEAMSPHAAGARDLLDPRRQNREVRQRARLLCGFWSGRGPAKSRSASSNSILQPRRPMVWEWAYRSAARSSWRTGARLRRPAPRPRAVDIVAILLDRLERRKAHLVVPSARTPPCRRDRPAAITLLRWTTPVGRLC